MQVKNSFTKNSPSKFRKLNINRVIRQQGILIFLIVLVIIISFISSDFITKDNIINLLKQISILSIVICGMTFCLVGGNFDLSVGSIISLSGFIAVSLLSKNMLLGIVAAIIAGAIVGLVNGLIIGKLKANAILVTIGTMSIVQAILLLLSKGSYVQVPYEHPYRIIGTGFVYGIPVPVIICAIIIIISYVLLHHTTTGRRIFAVGTNRVVSKFSGINNTWITVFTFIISGVLAAIAGIILASRVTSATPKAGVGYEFDAIAAAVLGGVSLFGGSGNVLKAVTGALIIGIIANSMLLIGIPFQINLIIKGLIIIGVVGLDNYFRGRQI